MTTGPFIVRRGAVLAISVLVTLSVSAVACAQTAPLPYGIGDTVRVGLTF